MTNGLDILGNIDTFVREIDSAQYLDDILKIIDKHIRRLGFEFFTYWLLWPKDGPRKPLYLTNYPGEWTEHYLKNDYKSDDMIGRYAALSMRPFTWDMVSSQYQFTERQELVFREGADIGLRAGGSVPIHGPKNAKAAFSVSSDIDEQAFKKLFAEKRHELHLIATYAHEKIMSLNLDRVPKSLKTLTAREIEILTWAARGKTRWEIGEIFSVSEETVKSHYKNIFRKLDTVNQTHAIAIALINGLIIP